MNTDHRSRFEEKDEQLFVISKLLEYRQEDVKILSDQLSMVVSQNFVLTLQEQEGKHFESIRDRIRNSKNRGRIIHPDYLAYALMDCMVDGYIEIITQLGELIEKIDEEVLKNPRKETIEKLYAHRSEMNFLRRTILPLKEVSYNFQRSDSSLVREMTREYIKNLSDHVVASLEAIDSYQLMIMDQMNLYNAGLSNKANEIMKTLTIFAALFIPLTFLAGIYGMNFEVLPELKWRWGYLLFWVVAVLIGGGLLLYFRKRKWF